jgi:hypothetical protein
MPDRCCVCNASIKEAAPRRLKWIPPEHRYRGRGFLAVLVHSAIADSYSQWIIVRVGRCREHRSRFKKVPTGIAVIATGFAGVVSVCANVFGPVWSTTALAISMVVMFAGMIVLGLPPRVRIENFRSDCAWLSGFGDAYVDALPSLADAHAASVSKRAKMIARTDGGRGDLDES